MNARLVPIVLLALACTDSGARRRTTLTVLYPADEYSWAVYVPSQFLVFLPLAARNAAGELEGRLARSWQTSPDFRTWTVHLRTDVRWHDGVPVTAYDAKFTLELLARPEVGAETPGTYIVQVIDDSTFTITFPGQPHGYWLDYIVFYPRHLLEGLDPSDFWRWEFWTRPVGNGPYRYVRHAPGTMMEFEGNPEHFRGRPKIERVVLKFRQASPSDVTELLSGAVDAIPWIDHAVLPKVRADPRFRVYHTIKPEHLPAVLWNHRSPFFRDARVRRALTLAIDRRALHHLLNLPEETPVFDVIFSRDQFYRGEVPAPLPYDPEAARRLLEEAGWRDADGDGIRERGGTPFRFTALASGDEQSAVFVQAQLRSVGVRMEVMMLDPAVRAERIRAGRFHAAVAFVNQDLHGEFGHLHFFGPGSLIGYESPRVGALLARAMATADPGESDRLYRVLMPEFAADAPVTFLAPLVRTTVAHRRVRGLSSPWRDDPVWYADELWLEDEK